MSSLARALCLFASVTASTAALAQEPHACACVGPAPRGLIWSSGSQAGPNAADARHRSDAVTYGAAGQEDARVHVHVGFRVVSFSPWCSLAGPKVRRFEDARQRWLRDHGYVGGVRTFMRDSVASQNPSGSKADLKPRAIIEIAPDVPRLRSRPQVRVVPQDQIMRRSATVSVKMSAPVAHARAK